MATKYREIVFMQGDDGREVVDALCNVEGVVAHGPDAESIRRTVEYLSGWDYGEGEVNDSYSWSNDDHVLDAGEYVLSWNLGLGYVGLTHVYTERITS